MSQRQGVTAEDKIDVEAERDARISPGPATQAAGVKGEYGFVLTHGFAGATSGKVYDLGFD